MCYEGTTVPLERQAGLVYFNSLAPESVERGVVRRMPAPERKKIDMVMPINRNNELEIVALPEDVKLVRYDFLTNDEIVGGKQVGDLTP